MNTANELSTKEVQLFRHQNYSIRILNQDRQQEATKVLIQVHEADEPMSEAFCSQFPEHNANKYQTWMNFYGPFMDDAATNRLSVAAYDMDNNDELVGISAAKDFNFHCPQFEAKTLNSFNFGSAQVAALNQMIEMSKPEQKQLLKKEGLVLDIWGCAIKREHTGKKILHKMMLANEMLARQLGFGYGFSFACNFKTGIALSKLNYEKIAELDTRKFEFEGVKPFCMTDQLQRYLSIWLRKL